VVGINAENIYLISIQVSAILACIAGILISFEHDLRYDIGIFAILMGIVSSIIGGIGNIPASIIGGFLLGIIENMSVWVFPPGYKRVISFGILIAFLLVRPQGIFGKGNDEFLS